jgi:1-acyl-sn-glycerol-3-phosphate acyltransferase
MLRTFFVCAVILFYILFVGGPFLLASVISGRTEALYKVGILGARFALWLGGVKVEAHGTEKIPRQTAVIFMPNHQSNCDPPAIITLVPPVIVIAKQEFFKVPILGQGMKLRGFVPVDRTNRERAIAAVREATAKLKAGYSFLAYPEGTRSPDGRLQPFKKGVFMMAIESGAPIVPISVSGGAQIMHKGDIRLHPGRLRVTFHDPIPTDHLTPADRERLIDLVRAAIASGLADNEKPLDYAAEASDLP